MDSIRRLTLLLAALPCLGALAAAQRNDEGRVLRSGGALIREQASYDVEHYDLELQVMPASKSIEGSLGLRAKIVVPTIRIALDLDRKLEVRGVVEGEVQRVHEHRDDRIWIELGRTRQPGETLELRVAYGGVPQEAVRAPWDGGFTWSTSPGGEPWIATTCQGEGADLWWPCKDHPSDEPDSMDLHIRVPNNLVCASAGKLVGLERHGDRTRTYHWHVSTPINNYGVSLGIGPFEVLESEFESITGETVPIYFYVLPPSVDSGRALLPEIVDHLEFMEELFGPYPFRADKYGVVETPHLGMEHQTLIAYGYRFQKDPNFGYDWLHHHELSHEWWGNLVTAADWNDFWIHEGFGTYAQNLYVERIRGAEAYRESMAINAARILNEKPVAPREYRDTKEMYYRLDLSGSDNDIYFKGGWILHTLRYLIGDEPFFRAVRRMAYPDPAAEFTSDGSACRFATTDEFLAICERESGRELDWFFEVYLRQASLPRLDVVAMKNVVHLSWSVEGDLPFGMPVEVKIGDELRRIEVGPEGASFTVPLDVEYEIDPHVWILKQD